MKADGMTSHSRYWNGAHTMKNPHNSFTKPLHPQDIEPSQPWFDSEMKFEIVSRTKTVASLFLFSASLLAAPASKEVVAKARSETFTPTELIIHQATYDVRVTDEEARFLVAIDAESLVKQEAALTLFEGELALLPTKLPRPLRIERDS